MSWYPEPVFVLSVSYSGEKEKRKANEQKKLVSLKQDKKRNVRICQYRRKRNKLNNKIDIVRTDNKNKKKVCVIETVKRE